MRRLAIHRESLDSQDFFQAQPTIVPGTHDDVGAGEQCHEHLLQANKDSAKIMSVQHQYTRACYIT